MSIRNPNPITIIHAQREPGKEGQRRLDDRLRSNGLLLIPTSFSLLVTSPESDLIRSEHVTVDAPTANRLDRISDRTRVIAPPMAGLYFVPFCFTITSNLASHAREREIEIDYARWWS